MHVHMYVLRTTAALSAALPFTALYVIVNTLLMDILDCDPDLSQEIVLMLYHKLQQRRHELEDLRQQKVSMLDTPLHGSACSGQI